MPFRLVHILLLLAAFAGTGEVWSQEEGLASYYHNRFHGRKAASGWGRTAGNSILPMRASWSRLTEPIPSVLSSVSPTWPI